MMTEQKKNTSRFTIQFNPCDGQHVQVTEILNMQGRKKAQFIVNAVMCYEASINQSAQTLSEEQSFHFRIKAIVQQLLSEDPSFKRTESSQTLSDIEKPKRKILQTELLQNDIEISDEDVGLINDMISELRK